jgi:hypothetical protein
LTSIERKALQQLKLLSRRRLVFYFIFDVEQALFHHSAIVIFVKKAADLLPGIP